MNVKVLITLLLMPSLLWGQGFAGLGTAADGFAVPKPNPVFSFPEDHGPHPDYRIEWWYVTANLKSEDGADYGLQWTLFRSALAPHEAVGWQSPQVWFAHAAVTTPSDHFATERFARGGVGIAGAEAAPFRAWIDEWTLEGPNFDRLSMRATGPNFAYDMELQAQGPLIFHGEQGFSVKSQSGQASYYYSQPFYDISGTLRLPDGDVSVSGSAWLDREWSSQPLADNQLGWDWFSLSFDSGDKLMGFQLRQSDNTGFTSSTWIDATGTATPYGDGDFSATILETYQSGGRKIPISWRVMLPETGVDVTVTAINPNAWMDLTVPYWEGPVRIQGSHSGRGYLEMTGYE